MSNAVLYLNPEAYDTSKSALMGRHAAGESFLRGYLRHAEVDAHHFWNVGQQPLPDLEAFVNRVEPIRKNASWIAAANRNAIAKVGVLNMPNPRVAQESWARRPLGDASYSICGITHTTASHQVMDFISDLMIAPVQPWDALICTSRAVHAAVERQVEATTDYLVHTLGASKLQKPRLETIPLGINADDFITTPAQKTEWRQKLGITDDTVVALYVGRFSPAAKMNPLPMALALERAATSTGKKIAWVVAGWASTDALTTQYHASSRALCPSVHYIPLDGRQPDVRFSIWAVGDFFLSLSDNIQETFGLTPVEAMAAGMPNVVSDWDGYRDTVRHGVDGFRIATYTASPGTGEDLAYRYANQFMAYDAYVASASQVTAVDVDEAAHAIATLVENPDLRRTMGAAARERAVQVFDWETVIKSYQSLWGDLNARRLAERAPAPRPRNIVNNPWRMDPFSLFSSYPTEFLTSTSIVSLRPGVTWADVQARRADPFVRFGGLWLPSDRELEGLVAALSQVRQTSVGALTAGSPRAVVLQRGLLYLAKYGFATIIGRSDRIAD